MRAIFQGDGDRRRHGGEGGEGPGRYGLTRRDFNVLASVVALLASCGAAVPAGTGAEPLPRVLAFGDSLTAGYGLPADQAFPARLEAKLKGDGIEARVINAGVSAETTAGGLARLDWSLADKPDIVILELGANDMLRGLDPKMVRDNLDAMLQRIKASGARVLLAGMITLANWDSDYQREFNAIYPSLAEKHGVTLYPFFLDGVAMKPELNQPDGLHPNARGVEIIVERIAPYVARLLREGQE